MDNVNNNEETLSVAMDDKEEEKKEPLSPATDVLSDKPYSPDVRDLHTATDFLLMKQFIESKDKKNFDSKSIKVMEVTPIYSAWVFQRMMDVYLKDVYDDKEEDNGEEKYLKDHTLFHFSRIKVLEAYKEKKLYGVRYIKNCTSKYEGVTLLSLNDSNLDTWVLGFMAFYPENYIKTFIWIAPKFREQGFGSFLVKSLYPKKVIANSDSFKFWEKMGYRKSKKNRLEYCAIFRR